MYRAAGQLQRMFCIGCAASTCACSYSSTLLTTLSLILHPPQLPPTTVSCHLSAGASPISAEVMQFLRICFSCHVLEGYGMTETSCTMTITRPDDPTIGHVGAPIPCCELKLVDIPEMNYVTSDKPYPRCGSGCNMGDSADGVIPWPLAELCSS